jgi:hypothetical protein
LDYADQRYYAAVDGRFNTADPYRASAGASDPGSWNRYAYVGGDPINYNDPEGRMASEVFDGPVFFSYAVSSVLNDVAVLYSFGFDQRTTGVSVRKSQVQLWEDMFDIDTTALYAYAKSFSGRLRDGGISTECQKDIVDLGISPDVWADKLDSIVLLNGIGDSSRYAEVLPLGSLERETAQQRNMTVGSNFGQGSGTVAISSVNDSRVWIDPRRVNPGDPIAGSALMAHEALHKFGLLDGKLQDLLHLPRGASVNISEKLGQDCFPGTPGTQSY